MTVPTPDFTSDDVSTGFTEISPPITYVPDQHNPSSNVAFLGDTVDRLDLAAVSLNGDTGVTYSGWLRFDATPPAVSIPFSQFGSGAGVQVVLEEVTGQVQLNARNDAGNQTTTSFNGATIDDGEWHHLILAANGSNGQLRFLIDGVQPSYTVTDSDIGTGFTGFNATSGAIDYSLGGRDAGTLSFEGILSRPRIWRQALSTTIMLEEFNNEVALIPSADDDDLIGGSGKINFRLDILNQLRWNRGIRRFIRS